MPNHLHRWLQFPYQFPKLCLVLRWYKSCGMTFSSRSFKLGGNLQGKVGIYSINSKLLNSGVGANLAAMQQSGTLPDSC